MIAIQRQLPEGLGVVVDDDGADARATWKAVHDGALTVFREPGVLERTMRGMRGNEVPVEMALIPRLSDLHVHTWDLAARHGRR